MDFFIFINFSKIYGKILFVIFFKKKRNIKAARVRSDISIIFSPLNIRRISNWNIFISKIESEKDFLYVYKYVFIN